MPQISSTALVNRFRGRRPNPLAVFFGSFLTDLGGRLAEKAARERAEAEQEEEEQRLREEALQGEFAAQSVQAELLKTPEQLGAARAQADTGILGVPTPVAASTRLPGIGPIPALGQRPQRRALETRLEAAGERISEKERRATFEEARVMLEAGGELVPTLERVGQKPADQEATTAQLTGRQIGRLSQVAGTFKQEARVTAAEEEKTAALGEERLGRERARFGMEEERLGISRRAEERAAAGEERATEDRELINRLRALNIEATELQLQQAREQANKLDPTAQDIFRGLALTLGGFDRFGAEVFQKALNGEPISVDDIPDQVNRELLTLATGIWTRRARDAEAFNQEIPASAYADSVDDAMKLLEAVNAAIGGEAAEPGINGEAIAKKLIDRETLTQEEEDFWDNLSDADRRRFGQVARGG